MRRRSSGLVLTPFSVPSSLSVSIMVSHSHSPVESACLPQRVDSCTRYCSGHCTSKGKSYPWNDLAGLVNSRDILSRIYTVSIWHWTIQRGTWGLTSVSAQSPWVQPMNAGSKRDVHHLADCTPNPQKFVLYRQKIYFIKVWNVLLQS